MEKANLSRVLVSSPVKILLEDSLTQAARQVLLGAALALELIEEPSTITLPDRRFVYVNAAFERLYGLTSAAVLGRAAVPIHTRSVPDQLVEAIFKGTLAGGWRGELENQNALGKRFEIHLRTRPLVTASGEVVGYLGICHPCDWQRVPMESEKAAPPPPLREPPLELDYALLSTREKAVLGCYGVGMNTKAIAEYLKISCPSVFTYRARIVQKLNLLSPAEFYSAAGLYFRSPHGGAVVPSQKGFGKTA